MIAVNRSENRSKNEVISVLFWEVTSPDVTTPARFLFAKASLLR
jgi:hypothetical protein